MADVICAWCQAVIGQSPVAHSHGICPPCYRQMRGIPDLSETELDLLPFGVIRLDAAGTVLAYNRAEGELAGRHPAEVVGRNFFREVAPCTSVQAFQGSFLAFLQGEEPSRAFRFTFHFPTGSVPVQIAFLRAGDGVNVVVKKGPQSVSK